MYSTFAVQSGESARQQRLALVLPYVLLWSNRAVIHLDRDDSWINPPGAMPLRRTREMVLPDGSSVRIYAPTTLRKIDHLKSFSRKAGYGFESHHRHVSKCSFAR
jgi:hypothetical protein